MSENSRIYPHFNPSGGGLGNTSFPDCHWNLCRQFMDRYRSVLPAEQLYALSHIFASTQLLLRGNTDQTMQLVLDLVRDQVPEGGATTTEVDHVENQCCWERKAEPEFPKDAEVTVKQEPQEVIEESVSECSELEWVKSEEMITLKSEELDHTQPLEILENIVPEPPLKANLIRPSSFDFNNNDKHVPFREPITIDSVYKNLVLFDKDFFKTQAYYNRIGCGQLELTVKLDPDHHLTHATIHVAHLNLSQASAKDRSTAIQMASKLFIEGMKDQCYHVESLHPAFAFQRTTNLVQRIPLNGQVKYASKKHPSIMIDPAHYERIMRDFQARDNGYHLIFAADFTDLECNVLQGIADRLKIPGRSYGLPTGGRKRFLVLAKEIPPQDVVRRIVIEQDAELGFQYRVIHPQQRGNGVSGALCGSSVPKPKTKKKKLSEALACLTKFAPIQTLRSVDDVYRNLVLVGTDFEKTAQEFLKTKVGALLLSTSEHVRDNRPCRFNATVQVGKFLLAEARNSTKKSAKMKAKVAFFKKAKMYCYQIIMKQTARTEIFVTKRQVPNSNNCHRFFEDFSKDSLEKELVFSSEFSKADIDIFISIATILNLKACSPEEDKYRRLRIVGQRLPALAIVERIVLAKDAYLSAIYEVIPPRIGARSVESPSMD